MKSCEINNLETSSVIYMEYMFGGCKNLSSLDLSTWNIENVKDIKYMFSSCKKLSSLNLSGWNPCNVESVDRLFYSCDYLNTIYANDWTKNIKIGSNRAEKPFLECTKLPGYNSKNVYGNMCKPQSMGGYFTDPQ